MAVLKLSNAQEDLAARGRLGAAGRRVKTWSSRVAAECRLQVTDGRMQRGEADGDCDTTIAEAALEPSLLRRVVVEAVTPRGRRGAPSGEAHGRRGRRRRGGRLRRRPRRARRGAAVAAARRGGVAAKPRWRRSATTAGALPSPARSSSPTTSSRSRAGSIAARRWQHGLEKKIAAGQDVSSERLEGTQLRPTDGGRSHATRYARVLRGRRRARARAVRRVVRDVPALGRHRSDRAARRSRKPQRGCPTSRRWASTSSTCRRSIRSARSFRKGRNNSLTPRPGDPGSPWAIGADEGGHTAVEPGLGTLDDFDRFVARGARATTSRSRSTSRSRRRPIIPTSSEHPSVVPPSPRRHDQVRREPAEEIPGHLPVRLRVGRLAGALARAEGRDRVLDRARRDRSSASTTRTPSRSASGSGRSARSARRIPDAIFLAEAFTRPKIMRYLAKAGFSQSYTYFTWRNTKAELEEYFTELTADRRRASTCGRTFRQHARHPARVPADGRARRRSRCAWCSRRRSAPATASTAASSCARTRR